jgi:hypothetical protein
MTFKVADTGTDQGYCDPNTGLPQILESLVRRILRHGEVGGSALVLAMRGIKLAQREVAWTPNRIWYAKQVIPYQCALT